MIDRGDNKGCPYCGHPFCDEEGDCLNEDCPGNDPARRQYGTLHSEGGIAAAAADSRLNPLELTADETDILIKMVRARIRCRQAFHQPYPELTILVANLLNWSHNVGPGTQRGVKE